MNKPDSVQGERVVVETHAYKLHWRLRWLAKWLRFRSAVSRLRRTRSASPRKWRLRYQAWKRAERDLARDMDRAMFFGSPALASQHPEERE